MSYNTATPVTAPPSGLVTVTHCVYALHSLSLLIGVTTAATIIGAFVFGVPSIIAGRHQLCKERRSARQLPRVALSLADPDVLVCAPLVCDRRHVVHYYRGHSACAGGFFRGRPVGYLSDHSRVAGAAGSKADVSIERTQFVDPIALDRHLDLWIKRYRCCSRNWSTQPTLADIPLWRHHETGMVM